MHDHIELLTSAQLALEIGYNEGRKFHERTKVATIETLQSDREAFFECHWFERGGDCPFHDQWKRGFNAGYLSLPKPWS